MAKIINFSGLSDEDDTKEHDTKEDDNLSLWRLKRKRADDDEDYGELVSVDISIFNDATDGAHSANDVGSDTVGMDPRDLSDDERSISDADPGPIKIGPSKKGTKRQYNNGKRFYSTCRGRSQGIGITLTTISCPGFRHHIKRRPAKDKYISKRYKYIVSRFI